MTDDIDKIVRTLQEAILEGYSEKFKQEFSNPKNIGKIEDADSQVSITGVCGDTIEMYLAIKDALRIKPEDVDNYFEGLPDESKHCAKLAIDTLKAALNRYEK